MTRGARLALDEVHTTFSAMFMDLCAVVIPR
jgi:hypothetical protein